MAARWGRGICRVEPRRRRGAYSHGAHGQLRRRRSVLRREARPPAPRRARPGTPRRTARLPRPAAAGGSDYRLPRSLQPARQFPRHRTGAGTRRRRSGRHSGRPCRRWRVTGRTHLARARLAASGRAVCAGAGGRRPDFSDFRRARTVEVVSDSGAAAAPAGADRCRNQRPCCGAARVADVVVRRARRSDRETLGAMAGFRACLRRTRGRSARRSATGGRAHAARLRASRRGPRAPRPTGCARRCIRFRGPLSAGC